MLKREYLFPPFLIGLQTFISFMIFQFLQIWHNICHVCDSMTWHVTCFFEIPASFLSFKRGNPAENGAGKFKIYRYLLGIDRKFGSAELRSNFPSSVLGKECLNFETFRNFGGSHFPQFVCSAVVTNCLYCFSKKILIFPQKIWIFHGIY